jgi:hypothetical protein
MDEILFRISKFLPIRCDVNEANYIKYLSDSFDKLCNKIDDYDKSDGFAIIPFHLLFMMVLHYRALRIFKEQPENYRLAITFKYIEDKDKKAICDPRSPFNFSLFGESEVLKIFKLLEIKNDKLGKIKSLIKVRNNLAHATGNIESKLENKCEEYLGCLEEIQKLFSKSNHFLADEFLKELEENDDIEQFFESRFNSCLINEYDYQEIAKIFIESGKLSENQCTYLRDIIE